MSERDLVHVIDDDDAVRESLAFLLRTAALDVKTYESAKLFLENLPGDLTGCIVTDVRMPDMTGIELLKQLQARGITLPVIVITGHGDIQLAVEAMKSGAVDFLEKPFDDERMLEAVRAALNNRRKDEARSNERAEISERIASLSHREKQVLDGLVAGLPNKAIAHDLGISPRTVEVYRANVMTKMQAGSLSDLVRMALVVQSH
jgi:two-component system response regulator FixJ